MSLKAVSALVAIVGITIGGDTAFAASKSGYHFAEVRSHQFVEVWPSLNSDGRAIHLKVKVSNGRPLEPFNPTVLIDFLDADGRKLARYVKDYRLGPSGWGHGVDRTFDYNISRPELWADTKTVDISAFERPPGRGGWTMPLYSLDDPLKCLGRC